MDLIRIAIALHMCTLATPAAQFAANQAERPAGVPAYAPYSGIFGHVQAAWSPDDAKIVFATAVQRGDQGTLYTVPSSGGEMAPLLKGDYWSATPAWSPDGRRIAFMSRRGTQSQIWTADASTGELHQITKSQFGLQFAPSWSPDGKQIAYTSLPGPKVMIVPDAGGAVESFAEGLAPQWSPDGKRIAYMAPEPLGKSSICVKNIDGGEPRRLACSTGQDSTGTWFLTASWSPDGHRLVATRIVNGRSQLMIINVADDRIESTIPASGSALLPVWSHDGKRIAYTMLDSGCPGEIHTITLDGTRDTQVTRQRRYTTAELIRYESAGGLQIPAYLYERSPAGRNHAALVWLHGGWPGTGATLDFFDASIQYFVDHGFVVLAPNYRGSIGFGEELAAARADDWLDRIHDIAAAVKYLSSRPGVDPARIGVLGESAGGYLAVLSAGREPGLFAAVVDFYGPTDLAALARDVGRFRLMLKLGLGGTLEEKPEEYRVRSPITYVGRITAPVLILHGDADEMVPITQSVILAEALKRADKKCQFLIIPKAGHGFSGPDAVLAFEKTMQFLSTRLGTSRADLTGAGAAIAADLALSCCKKTQIRMKR